MKRRLVLTSVALCLLGLIVLVVPMALSLRSLYHHTDVLELQRELGVVIQRLPLPTGPEDVPGTSENHGLHRYARYDPAGVRVAGDGPSRADAVVLQALRGSTGEGVVGPEVVAALPLYSGDRVVGAVRGAEPTQEGTDRLLTALAQLSLLALAALAVAALAGMALFRRLLRPVDALRASAVRLGDGDFTALAPRTGIPELDEVGAALNSSNRRLRQLVERERQFSADASHELRTPIAALRAALETELLSPRPDREQVLREGLSALDRLEATVLDLLRLARGTPGDRGKLAVVPLLAEAVQRWRPAARERGRSIECAVQQPIPDVRCSRAALDHVLNVLLGNALRHGRGAVRLTAAAIPQGVALRIGDQGQLDPTLLPHLFQRRVAEDGHGIGLALARTLTEAEGGRLRVAQAAPTLFEIVLPVEGDAGPRGRQGTPVD